MNVLIVVARTCWAAEELDGDGVEFQARNLDLLAKIELKRNNIAGATSLFDHGVRLRSDTRNSWHKTARV
ncbi:MAG: hypothetical protein K2X93_29370 [Candidatus Obscuribacterales bacterium]|nr:hypothetical protein [Candidatus Obscuribacterales bacterium]